MSKYNSLIQFLESMAAKEGAAGNQYFKKMLKKINRDGKLPQIPLSDNLILKLERAEEAGGYFTRDGFETSGVDDIWNLVNRDNVNDSLGIFIARTDLGSNKKRAMMSLSEIYEDQNKRKGLGTKAYGALSKQYGNIVSDNKSTSKGAFKIYDKLGRELNEADGISPMFNKERKRRKIIESTKLPDYLKIFDDE